MSERIRGAVSAVLVALALFLFVVWMLRSIIGVIAWFANVLAFVLVIGGLLVVARMVRKG